MNPITLSGSLYFDMSPDPTKFFGCELGAQVQMDEKAERFIINGCHDQAKLQDLLFNFIEKFVLCHNCGNPETNLVRCCGRVSILAPCLFTHISQCTNK